MWSKHPPCMGGQDTTKSSRALTLTSESYIVATPKNPRIPKRMWSPGVPSPEPRVPTPNAIEHYGTERVLRSKCVCSRKERKTKTMSNTSKSSSDFPSATKRPPTDPPMQMAGKSTEKSQQKVPQKNIYIQQIYAKRERWRKSRKVKGKKARRERGKSAVLAKMENDVKCKLTAFNINSKTIGELHAREMKCRLAKRKVKSIFPVTREDIYFSGIFTNCSSSSLVVVGQHLNFIRLKPFKCNQTA